MPQNDQDKYSLDEIMERLRSRGHEDLEGEPVLVTRPDGTQVYKVKKRKRRSHQPHKEAQKRKRRNVLMGIAGMALLVLTLAGLLMGWIFQLNSRGYGQRVITSLEAATGAKVDIVGFRATPLSVGGDQVKLEWDQARLKAQQVSGDVALGGHLTGRWYGNMLNCGLVELDVSGPVTRAEHKAPADGNVSFFIPVRTPRLRIRFGQDSAQPVFAVHDARATFFEPGAGSANARLILEGGTFRLGSWGKFQIEMGSVVFQDGGMYIPSMVINEADSHGSEIRIMGSTEQPVPVDGGTYETAITFQNISGATLFGESMTRLIQGTFETSDKDVPGRLTLDPGNFSSLEVDAMLTTSERGLVTMARLPLFGVLSDLAGTSRLSEPAMTLREPFRYSRGMKGGLKLSGLDLELPRYTRIQGFLEETPDGQLSGALKVGLHPSLLDSSNSTRIKQAFREDTSFYYWADVTVSGTTRQPEDNMLELLRGTAQTAPMQGADMEDEFERLTNPER